jgi:hypothetical protein
MKKVGRPKGSYKKQDPNRRRCYGKIYSRPVVQAQLRGE